MGIETTSPANEINAAAASPEAVQPRPVSHTQENPVPAPHTNVNKSTIASPEPFIRIFLLAWAVRYIPRGLLGEVFSEHTLAVIKKPMDRFIDAAVVNRMEGSINHVLAKESAFVRAVKSNSALLQDSELYTKLASSIRSWRGDAPKEIGHIVANATVQDGKMALAPASKSNLRNLVRGRLDDIGYSLSLFVGSSALSLHYSSLVRSDIKNIFREAVAYEKDVPQEKITFSDISHSDNRIVQATVKNYRHKMVERLGSDSLFLFTTPLKSMHVTDFLLGVKGVQMFRDTWRRHPTIFEDLVTFVNNKINPTNGLGQPVSIGEVFDLYQHYAQTYAPEKAFVGVIEHAKSEGARWGENQLLFHRMTELLNKTYAYKHNSIVDPKTGLTTLQADFALPKFIYLLGHDLIDVNQPEKTLVTIEVANRYGIPAVKDMHAMLKAGKSLENVMERYAVTLPEIEQVAQPDTKNALLAKGAAAQIDQQPSAPVNTVNGASIAHVAPQAEAAHGLSA